MKRKTNLLYGGMCIVLSLFFLAACQTTGSEDTQALQQKIEAQQATIEKLESDVQSARATTGQQTTDQVSGSTAQDASDLPLLPPDAKPGECYARVFVPPVYETVTEEVLKKAAGERIEIIPAQYEMVDEKILVSEASEKLTTIPAEYEYKTQKEQVQQEELVWRTSLKRNSPKAGDTLLNTAKKHGIDLDAAQVGQCFHEHYLPPVFETVYEDELVEEESYRIEVIPARYETVEEKILVTEASEKLINIPATYRWEEEKVLIKEAHTQWKKGKGLIEKVDNTTGELMCLVEVPAEYKTVKRKVIDQPARVEKQVIPAVYKTVKVRKQVAAATENKVTIPAKYKKVARKKMVSDGQVVWHEIHNKEHPRNTRTGNQICLTQIPAKYKTMKKKVVVSPAKTVSKEIPAKYKTIKVKKVEKAAEERKIAIPAEYQTITKKVKKSEGYLEWRKVLCETNTTSDVVSRLQTALIEKGYTPGPVDGVYGRLTTKAVHAFQVDNGLATGGLTFETLNKLGVR